MFGEDLLAPVPGLRDYLGRRSSVRTHNACNARPQGRVWMRSSPIGRSVKQAGANGAGVAA